MSSIFKCVSITVGKRVNDGSDFFMGTWTEHKDVVDMQADISIGDSIKRIVPDRDAVDGNNVVREGLIRKRGERVMFKTTPYDINGRTVEKVTVLVFDGESAQDIANNLLKRNRASVLKADGVTPTVVFDPIEKTPPTGNDDDSSTPMSKKELQDALTAKGIAFKATDSVKALQAAYDLIPQ